MQNPALISGHESEYKYWHDMGISEPKIHKSYYSSHSIGSGPGLGWTRLIFGWYEADISLW
jgi:hypothetical protein